VRAWELLGETRAPDGTSIKLTRRADEYLILANGKPLMSSRLHGSEDALATLACGNAEVRDHPRVLVGGLGMGFTLRAVLDVLPSAAVVTVAELLPAAVEWNRKFLGALAAHPLKDARSGFRSPTSGSCCARTPVDSMSSSWTWTMGRPRLRPRRTSGLYDNGGVVAAHAALRPLGTLAVWSAWEDRKFEQRLRFHGFDVKVARVRARRQKGGPRHTIFLGRKRGTAQA